MQRRGAEGPAARGVYGGGRTGIKAPLTSDSGIRVSAPRMYVGAGEERKVRGLTDRDRIDLVQVVADFLADGRRSSGASDIVSDHIVGIRSTRTSTMNLSRLMRLSHPVM